MVPRYEQGAAEQAEILDRYWDEIILGDPDTVPELELEASSARVVRRLEAAGRASGSAEARERVWRSLQVSFHAPVQENGYISMGDEPPPSISPVPSATTSLRRLRRRWPLTELVAATFLLMLLGGAIAGPLLYPKIADLWTAPDSPGIPISRGGPARTGEQPGPGPENVPDIGWQIETGAALSASPAVVDGVVYIGTYDRQLLALDAEEGTEQWSFETEGAVGGSATLANGVVYVGDEAGFLYAVDAEAGVELWRVDVGGSLYTASPVVVDGLIYLTSGAGGTAPAYDDGVVYVGGDGSASRAPLHLLALDVATGQERWRHDVGANGLFAFDAITGEERWHFRTFAPIYNSSPAVTEGAVYVGSKDGTIFAVDVETGQERWQMATGKAIYSSSAVVDGVLYVGSTDGFLYALDAATGSLKWQTGIGIVRRSSAAVADGVVYIVGGNYLWALDAATGDELWRAATGGDGEGSPAVIDGMVFVSGKISVIGGEAKDAFGVLFALAEEPGQ